jgi:methylated-DNA-[protein]-cysteine S-methyltransferase
MAAIFWDTLQTGFGPVSLAVNSSGALLRIDLSGRRGDGRRDEAACRRARQQLIQYFAGDRRDFELELEPQGTPFQRRVWDALRAIPYGEVSDYGAVAQAIGKPGAARAVGQANGSNPIPIVIPCHRVVARDRSLGGFSSGLAIKRYLLLLEGSATAA